MKTGYCKKCGSEVYWKSPDKKGDTFTGHHCQMCGIIPDEQVVEDREYCSDCGATVIYSDPTTCINDEDGESYCHDCWRAKKESEA